MLLRVLIALFILEMLALIVVIIIRARWLPLHEVAERGYVGLVREVRSQFRGWPILLVLSVPLTWLAIAVLAVLGFEL